MNSSKDARFCEYGKTIYSVYEFLHCFPALYISQILSVFMYIYIYINIKTNYIIYRPLVLNKSNIKINEILGIYKIILDIIKYARKDKNYMTYYSQYI